jgi:chloramphenicol-sensitive protein RarD
MGCDSGLSDLGEFSSLLETTGAGSGITDLEPPHCVVFIFLALLVTIQKSWRALREGMRHSWWLYGLAGLILGGNWLLYVWGVNSGQILETSPGSFMTSIFTILFGVIFKKEKLRPAQWIPIGFLFLATAYLTIRFGTLPWLALSLGISFSLYSLLKKKATLQPMHGLTIETGFLFFPCILQLALSGAQGTGAFGNQGLYIDLLLIGGGVFTGLPLLLFAGAVKEIPLWLLGLIQYIPPTMFFLIGTVVYKEPLSAERLVAFGLIWAALLIFWLEGCGYKKKREHVP